MLSSCGERNRDFKTVDSVRKKKKTEKEIRKCKKKKKRRRERKRPGDEKR